MPVPAVVRLRVVVGQPHDQLDRRTDFRRVFRSRHRCSAALLAPLRCLVTFLLFMCALLCRSLFSDSPLGPLCFPYRRTSGLC